MYKVEKFQFSYDRSLTFVGIRARGYGKDCYYPSSLVDIVVLTLELLLMLVQFQFNLSNKTSLEVLLRGVVCFLLGFYGKIKANY